MIPPLSANHLREVCNVLADTNLGLTGAAIGSLLQELGINDYDSSNTKRYRLYHALVNEQQMRGDGERVKAFIERVMEPVRYHNNASLFHSRRAELNTILAFAGYTIENSGKLVERPQAFTLEDAKERADRLCQSLLVRGIHPDVLLSCQAQYLVDNYFHAVLEANKSVASKLRQISSLSSEGSKLVDDALGGSSPRVIINEFNTESRYSEQSGVMNLLKGMFSAIRNPLAHELSVDWTVDEQEALDLLALASFLHRKLDRAMLNTLHLSKPDTRR